MTIRVEILAWGHGGVTEGELSKLAAWQLELFASDRETIDAFTWEDKQGMGFNVQTYSGDALIGFAHVFTRLIRCDGSAALMGGLGSVMTDREHQGKAVGSVTVKKAGEIILESFRADLGVLLCTDALAAFYERLGWRRVPGSVWLAQPSGRIRWPQVAMVLPGASGDGVPGELDLLGLPF